MFTETRVKLFPGYENTKGKASEKQVGGDHYRTMAIQPGHYIRANNLGWYEGNVVKYISRYKQKGGREDLLKVKHYVDLILEELDKRDLISSTTKTFEGQDDE